ncbi:MAG: HlyD family secretion protein [SAR324 cluster bacterium]|nr:HlyD family secretion protein [SAR324 cluster bacterium]
MRSEPQHEPEEQEAPAQEPPRIAEIPVPQAPTRTQRRGLNLRLWLFLLLILAVGGGYGTYWWNFLRGTVATDDAYVDARVVSVSSRLSGRTESVLAQEGMQVKGGQVLVRIAADKLEIRLSQMRAATRSAQAHLDNERNNPRPEEIEMADAEIRVWETKLARAREDQARAEQLARANAIAAQELYHRRGDAAEAFAQLEVARRRLSLLMAGTPTEEIRKAEADLELAEARLRAAEADIEDATVRSPVTGVVAKRLVDAGEYVNEGQALFQIVETGKTWVVANLEEDQIANVKEGQTVSIWVDAYPSRELKGRVGPLFAATLSRFSLFPSTSASGSFVKVTQRVPVRIDWEIQELPPMFPGLNVQVRIAVGVE